MDHETHGTLVGREEITTTLDRPPLLSWGAILGGLVFVVAISWLLNLLGMALGTSIADATDGEAMTSGLGTATVVWLVISSLVAYFVGSLLTARLSGKVDNTVGMLHGMTLWGLATTLMLVLSYWGVSGLAQTGYSMLKATGATAASAVAGMTPSLSTAEQAASSLTDIKLSDNIKARLKRRASSVIAKMDAEGGPTVSQEEVRQTIEELDAETVQAISSHIVAGELTAAREELTEQTELDDDEVRDIISGLENEFEEQLGTEGNETGLIGDIGKALNRQISDFAAELDAEGGAEVSKGDVREALREMDRQTMTTVATRLIQGDASGAKDALAANTNLSTRQINDIVNGVNDDVSRTVKKYREQAEQAVEAASTYAQATLWTVFVAAAMGLGVSLLGGWLGAESSRQIEIEVRRQPVA